MTNLHEHYGYCPYCLAIKSTVSFASCYFENKQAVNAPGQILTIPPALIEWLDKMCADPEFRMFSLDSYNNAFLPVAIINGSPVCSVHLWVATETPAGYSPQRRR